MKNIQMKLKGKAVSGRKQFFLFVLMQIFVFNSYGDAVKQVTVSSPDKKLQIKLDCAGKGISYAVLIDGKAVLEHSRMGLQFQGATWGEASTIADVDTRSNDSTWTNPLGKNSNVVDRYNEANIEFKESAGGKFAIILRAYNDGLAFRYVLPEDKSAALSTLTAEQTEFAFSGDYPCYSGNLPKNVFNGKHAYEWEYLPGKLSELKGGQVLGIPLLVQTPAAWVAIAEADLLDWSGMWLSKPANSSASTKVGVQLAPRLEDRGW